MNQLKILMLGSTGFVGNNIYEVLKRAFLTIKSSRDNKLVASDTIYFDLEKEETWNNILKVKPHIIVNATGYGVVKHQKDIEKLKNINYYQPYRLKNFLDRNLDDFFWIQIGSAFEYDLNLGALSETSPTVPLTDYGITKLLFSQFLQQSGKKNFIILRPFAMFGPGEDKTKIIPALLVAQKERKLLSLTSGQQQRDYFFVEDLGHFILTLIRKGVEKVAGEIVNIGSNSAVAIKELAIQISPFIPDFDATYWGWGQVEQRVNEGDIFFNNSEKSRKLGFSPTARDIAFQKTINYYYQVIA